jgi:hypothetical protein
MLNSLADQLLSSFLVLEAILEVKVVEVEGLVDSSAEVG